MQHPLPTGRFKDRVSDDVHAGPGYPAILHDLVAERCSLVAPGVIADAGSGTGVLPDGRTPRVRDRAPSGDGAGSRSQPRRQAALHQCDCDRGGHPTGDGKRRHGRRPHRPCTGSTPRGCEPSSAAPSWCGTTVASNPPPSPRGYDALLLDDSPEYLKVVHRNVSASAPKTFSGPAGFETLILDNAQAFDGPLLVARNDSQFQFPKGAPTRAHLMAELRTLFERTTDADGHIFLDYDTRVHFCTLSRSPKGRTVCNEMVSMQCGERPPRTHVPMPAISHAHPDNTPGPAGGSPADFRWRMP